MAMKFRIRWRASGLLLAVFAMAGCATQHIDLAPEKMAQIKTVKLISIIPQAALVPTVRPSMVAMTAAEIGAMFGAIGGAIGGAIAGGIEGSHHQAAAEKLAALVEPQERIEIRQEFLDKLKQAAVDSERFSIQNAETVTEGDGSMERNLALWNRSDDGVLTVFTYYYLSPDFKVFNVTSKTELWEKGTEKEIYLGHWMYHSVPQTGDTDEQVIAAWAADDGKALVTVAHDAIDKIAMMMEVDLLGHALTPEDLGTASGSYTREGDGANMNYDGKVVMRKDGWDVVRDSDGTLHATYVPQ